MSSKGDTVKVSVRLTRGQYRHLKLLVDAGYYSSLSEAMREAILKLLRERRQP